MLAAREYLRVSSRGVNQCALTPRAGAQGALRPAAPLQPSALQIRAQPQVEGCHKLTYLELLSPQLPRQ